MYLFSVIAVIIVRIIQLLRISKNEGIQFVISRIGMLYKSEL